MEMPSQEEQEIARNYVLKRPLERPDTSILRAIIYVCIYLLSSVLTGILLLRFLSWLGVFAFLSDSLLNFKHQNEFWFNFIFIAIVCIIIGIFLLKPAAIGCVRLYQRYAPEHVRRRCLFKPTCSEYAILAIKKYGLIIGLVKTYFRAFKRCRGNIYRIDYP